MFGSFMGQHAHIQNRVDAAHLGSLPLGCPAKLLAKDICVSGTNQALPSFTPSRIRWRTCSELAWRHSSKTNVPSSN